MPVPDPITRQEQFLAAAAGGSADNLPDPITREELYLKAIADNAGGGGGSSSLAGLTDVDLTNPTDGQTLVYDATAGKWVNGSGGGVTILQGVGDGYMVTLDITFAALYALLQSSPVYIHYVDADEEMTLNDIILQFGVNADSRYFARTASNFTANGVATDTVVFSLLY